MRIIELSQRSKAWLDWRATGIGSSDGAAILGVSPWTTRQAVLRDKRAAYRGEKVAGKKDNGAMQRGRRLEPLIVQLYEDMMGWQTRAICAEHSELSWIKASYDGYNDARKLPVEMKAPNRDDHLTALANCIPEKYLPQCYHLMMVAEVKRMHYVSYSDYFPQAERFKIVEVEADDEIMLHQLSAYKAFWEEVVRED